MGLIFVCFLNDIDGCFFTPSLPKRSHPSSFLLFEMCRLTDRSKQFYYFLSLSRILAVIYNLALERKPILPVSPSWKLKCQHLGLQQIHTGSEQSRNLWFFLFVCFWFFFSLCIMKASMFYRTVIKSRTMYKMLFLLLLFL